MLRRVSFACLFLVLSSCESDAETQDSDVVVNTESEKAWAQYVANVEFAEDYEARCTADPESSRPRVLVTGFGRFLENKENATGRILERLVPGLTYPLTNPPAEGKVDDPEPQTAVLLSTLTLPDVGEVDVCAMVLPVFWDVASILVLKEAQAFEPDFVLMNGIAGNRQPIWMELGSVNAAVALPDGSGSLAPIKSGTPLLSDIDEEDHARGLLLSYAEVRADAEARIAALAEETDDTGTAFGDIAQGVRFAGFPRESNTYLCNNTTFVVNYVLDHAGDTVRLLEPSHPRPGGPTGVDFALVPDLSEIPRVFVHWPKDLAGEHLDRGASVMATIIGAQLTAKADPVRGDPSMADVVD